ncbi:hypothetical protein EYF80_013918 [Liparis tanakae]|uniref:Uncharacterized protein n=1 Tax=Liparis tanakae TaxID=230148 RepID=A0A4Z2IDG5_9TELE|nr:hypothetical protein EYF80_013918 [Liparis tanakae]
MTCRSSGSSVATRRHSVKAESAISFCGSSATKLKSVSYGNTRLRPLRPTGRREEREVTHQTSELRPRRSALFPLTGQSPTVGVAKGNQVGVAKDKNHRQAQQPQTGPTTTDRPNNHRQARLTTDRPDSPQTGPTTTDRPNNHRQAFGWKTCKLMLIC